MFYCLFEIILGKIISFLTVIVFNKLQSLIMETLTSSILFELPIVLSNLYFPELLSIICTLMVPLLFFFFPTNMPQRYKRDTQNTTINQSKLLIMWELNFLLKKSAELRWSIRFKKLQFMERYQNSLQNILLLNSSEYFLLHRIQ